MRYKAWRSNKDGELFLLCREGAGAFNALPNLVRNLGPWTGSKEGEVDGLRLPYRTLLVEQGFVILYCHVSKLELEAAPGVRALHPANAECPECKGKGRIPMHHGLRDKECPRCRGKGWIRPPSSP
jgi:hypothetical protein